MRLGFVVHHLLVLSQNVIELQMARDELFERVEEYRNTVREPERSNNRNFTTHYICPPITVKVRSIA